MTDAGVGGRPPAVSSWNYVGFPAEHQAHGAAQPHWWWSGFISDIEQQDSSHYHLRRAVSHQRSTVFLVCPLNRVAATT